MIALEQSLEFQIHSKNTIRLGIISDTHVPDRAGALHPAVLPHFQQHQVDYIVHAGDVCSMSVIRALETVAPVVHVSGNRDFLMRKKKNLVLYFMVNGVMVGVTHGHGDLLSYLWDKLPYLLEGYQFQRYRKKLDKIVHDAQVIIFGHTHTSENRWQNGKLYFNSGSAFDRGKDRRGPSIGLIDIDAEGRVEASIIPLKYLRWVKGKWES